MRLLIRLLIGVVVLVAIGAIAKKPLQDRWAARNRPEFKTERLSRGNCVRYVQATGKIKPVETILIGSFVSGPIKDMPETVDFNQPIKKGDLMALVDDRLYKAQVASGTAALAIARAEVLRATAQLQQAKNDERRAVSLREKREGFVSQAEMDRLRFSREQLEATVLIAEAAVDQAVANLTNSQTNLAFTKIEAPKDGIIIDRKIEPGQTLAAQFQTPELFEIGVDMDKKMHLYAAVDETEIGLIKEAQVEDMPVTFTVFAYREEHFTGKIWQIRQSATETQGVVTYPVVVEAENSSGKLMPGMTADLSFKIAEEKNVLRVPNQALRFFPKKEHVRQEDHAILDGSAWANTNGDEEGDSDVAMSLSAAKRATAQQQRSKRHVWVVDGEKLKAIEVEVGMADQEEGKTTQLISGELAEDQEVVVGVKPKTKGFFGG